MFRLRAALAVALFAFLVSESRSYARPITLSEAIALVDRSPSLAIARTAVEEASGNADQAARYTYNPTIGASGGPVFGPGSARTVYDFEVGIGQPIELGGKRAARRAVARAERDAVNHALVATRSELVTEVRRAFQLALVAKAQVEVTSENETWARHFHEAAKERQRLGAATQTEVNVAVAGLGRAIASKKEAERERLRAKQALCDALGLAGADLDPSGPMPAFVTAPSDEEALVASALGARRDLAAAGQTQRARSADVDLADALAIPDPEITASWVRSALEDSNAIIVGVRVELPLWNRNQGNRTAARAIRHRATLELEALRREIDREVRNALRRYRAAIEGVAAFDQQVVGTLAENLQLARETLAAGKLGLLDINNVRRDLVESQLTYLAAIADAVEARAELEVAIGRPLEGTP